jgi:hypothetical protein
MLSGILNRYLLALSSVFAFSQCGQIDDESPSRESPSRIPKTSACANRCFTSEDCSSGFQCTRCSVESAGDCENTNCINQHHGKCIKAGPCSTNDDCGEAGFCYRDYNCATLGTCQPIPDMCFGIYATVCGCDGKNYYSSNCSAHQERVSVSFKGFCEFKGLSCADLQAAYLAAVSSAKSCLGGQLCNSKVHANLTNDCRTFVSGTGAIPKSLDDLVLQSFIMGCGTPISTCPSGIIPKAAKCNRRGICVDT